jgi:arsenite methyltransferase
LNLPGAFFSVDISMFINVSEGGTRIMENSNLIHIAVQDRYSALAECQLEGCEGTFGCCDAGTASFYDPALVADLPVDVTGLSLGCGDPVTIAELQPGETVLDLGSGGGIDCFLAAKQVGASGRVIGVDMTDSMLAKANANKAKLGAENIEFRKGYIEALPVEDNMVDVIMSNCVINLSPDKPSVFREAARVLKPGGRLAVSDIVTEGEMSDAMRADLSKWAECVTGAIDVEEYTGMMRAAGLVDIQVIDKTSAEGIVERKPGMPRVFSARITARKPA